ncbi:MAG: ATP-binding protein [SAR324 cluster bacterium]|uniref:ATP-binding protein n=1 Tax=SAR324 cluster bacterium TaxID=2024889 RepID=A0A7X9FTA9_9DELT|nr:ATP-binding protein [SAR324 cluster bacterium]
MVTIASDGYINHGEGLKYLVMPKIHHPRNLYVRESLKRIPDDAEPVCIADGEHPYKVILDSELRLREIRHNFRLLLEQIGVEDVRRSSLEIAFAEVLTNVYKHAYAKGDPIYVQIESYVLMRPQVNTRVFIFEIADFGRGIKSIRNLIPFHSEEGPIDPHNNKGSLGGGLLMACSGADEVHISNNGQGTSVRILRSLSDNTNGHSSLPEDLSEARTDTRKVPWNFEVPEA